MSVIAAVSTAQAAAPTNEEIWQQLQQMQQQMAEIQQQNKQLKTENEQLKDKVEASQQTALEANETVEALAEVTEQAVKSVSASASNTNIGGYGELHYNNLEDEDGNEMNEIDFHRFVLFFSHDFNDSLHFFSELEVEHAVVEGGSGAVELEQAYLQYDINDQHSVTAGLFLLPVGILNETHEPPTFYGTERNPVEKNIIPTTWWEAGVMTSGELTQGFSYDIAATSGLKINSGTSYKIRKGRGQVAQATANDPAYTARLKWTGIPGIELAATVQYQQDVAQSLDPTVGSATLFETHAVIQRGDFGLRALYATWDIDGSGPKAIGADEQTGWYIEPSYQINSKFGLFARFNEWDNSAGNSVDSEYQQFDVGVNWWPHKDVVVKVDYQDQSAPAGKTELDGINVGLGYQF